MIRFNCHCTHEFLVPEDQAGGMVQCPKCSRLNDVPTLSDLANLEPDGSFKIGEGPAGPGKDVIPTATRAFTRDKQDSRGNDIDMRPSVDEFLGMGSEEIPLSLKDEELPGKPKYDPLTGELIETVQLKPPEKPFGPEAKSIPIAKRAVQYATHDLNLRVTPGTILLALFQPVNMFVMMFVVLAHSIFQAFALVVECGFFLMVPVLIIIAAMLVSHYGVVIEEIAVRDSDELPRPLRDFSVSEDLWNPFVRFCFALLVCFWPVIFQWQLRSLGMVGQALLFTLILFGVFFFPAALMTSVIAGSYLNMRPDRIIGVVRGCGPRYMVAVISFAVAEVIYLAGIGIVNIGTISLMRPGMHYVFLGFSIGSPVLLVGIYLMHFACWHLGLLYRGNHDSFPWILQRHVYSKRTDTIAQLEQARKMARRHDLLQKNKPDRDQRIAEIRDAEKAKRAKADAKPIWDRVADSQ
jgi:hypothetical protein